MFRVKPQVVRQAGPVCAGTGQFWAAQVLLEIYSLLWESEMQPMAKLLSPVEQCALFLFVKNPEFLSWAIGDEEIV
jgi:hypothetical protein